MSTTTNQSVDLYTHPPVSGPLNENNSMGAFILLGSDLPLRGVANPFGKYSKANMGDGQLNNVKVIQAISRPLHFVMSSTRSEAHFIITR